MMQRATLALAVLGAFVLSGLVAVTAGCTNGGTTPAFEALGRIAPSVPEAAKERVTIAQFADLPQPGRSSTYSAAGIVSGPDKLLWIIDDANLDFGYETAVVSIATSGKQQHVYYYPGGSAGAAFYDITVGPDGALWMTDPMNYQIVRLATHGGYSKFPGLPARPFGITTGPDKALWFTLEEYAPAIGRITTKGQLTTYPLSDYPQDIVVGPDHALWFTLPGYSSVPAIGRITLRGKIVEYTKGITGKPLSIAVGPDGALWFTEPALGTGRIGRITTSGSVTEYTKGITATEEPNGIAAGPDGAMWFTEAEQSYSGNAKIGRISMSGSIKEYAKGLTPQSGPSDITAGPDGRMWFVESTYNETGRVTL